MSAADPYLIRTVSREQRLADEQMGTKHKFWYREDDGSRWLFKFARPMTGEHWSEKIAAEIGHALRIPCARVELATCDGRPGSASQRFFEDDSAATLVHGNELLQEADDSYPRQKERRRGVSQHTVDAVLGRLEGVQPPQESKADLDWAADWFVGYLLLDAVVVNSDRHDENWGILQFPGGMRRLAPSYDHASCLGRELTDATRLERLHTNDDAFTVVRYADRARSPLYAEAGAVKPLHPADAFRLAGVRRPRAKEAWLERLHRTSFEDIERIVARVPRLAISDPARAFALAVLRSTRQNLLGSPEQAFPTPP